MLTPARRRRDLGRGPGLPARRGCGRLERRPEQRRAPLVGRRRRHASSTGRPISRTATRSTTTAGSSPASTARGASSRYERDGSRTTIVDRFEGKRLNSPNDIVVASDGAIWFTDPPYGILDDNEGYKADSELGGCFVFRLDRATGELTVVSDDLVHPNGLAFSPDETTLYVSDTSIARIAGGNHHILAFDVVDGRRLAVAARLRGHRARASRTASGSMSRATSGRRPATGSTSWTRPASSSGGSCCPRRPQLHRSAARTAGACSSPRPRPCGRSTSASAARSRPGSTPG